MVEFLNLELIVQNIWVLIISKRMHYYYSWIQIALSWDTADGIEEFGVTFGLSILGEEANRRSKWKQSIYCIKQRRNVQLGGKRNRLIKTFSLIEETHTFYGVVFLFLVKYTNDK